MAQFDIYRVDGTCLLDCQSNLLSSLNTRLVVPLMDAETAPRPADRLNPVFDIDGRSCVMMTQYLATVPAKILGQPIGTCADHHREVISAIDFLMTGF